MANQLLKPRQQRSIELDTKQKILGAVVDIKKMKGAEILETYNKTIEGIVVDINGNTVEQDTDGNAVEASDVDVAKNFKKLPEDRLFPVYKYHQPGNPEDVEAFILPVYGNGLWGNIWGYIALDTDLNTLKGAVFDHASETPGLGARITAPDVQDRYVGKKIFDESGNLKSVAMLKGENNPSSALDEHHIDGLSGATITGNGVNAMLRNYFEYYDAYFQKIGNNKSVALRL
jgi:Na+-transporting NADH:ubiquinone oxidoreductase subunit C